MNKQSRLKRPNELLARDRYQTQLVSYIQGDFSYNSHQLLKRICENGQKQPYLYGVPLYKIMLEVVKTMMMNQLEILFLGSTLQEMHWSVSDPCLYDYVQDVVDITPRLEKDKQSRRVQLGLILIAYIVKIYLNEDTSSFDFKIRDIIRVNFDKMYQVWVQKVQNNFKFNPKNMNKLSKQFDTAKKDKTFHIVDYNKLVAQFFKQNDGPIPMDQKFEYQHIQPHKYQNIGHNIRELLNQQQIQPPPEYSQVRNYHKVSDIGLRRNQSGNQFFELDYKKRSQEKNGFGLQLVGKSSIVDGESSN